MTKDLTLYQISETITALLDTEDLVTDPAQKAELQQELDAALALEVRKVDAFAGYLQQLDTAAAFIKDRVAELSDRRRAIENRRDRLEKYATSCIEVLPRNKKGGYARLEGQEYTLSLRAPLEAVHITDEAAVPAIYKMLTITVSAADWEQHIRRYNDMRALFMGDDEPLSPRMLGQIRNTECAVSKTELKKDLKAGLDIPGAELKYGDPTLQVK